MVLYGEYCGRVVVLLNACDATVRLAFLPLDQRYFCLVVANLDSAFYSLLVLVRTEPNVPPDPSMSNEDTCLTTPRRSLLLQMASLLLLLRDRGMWQRYLDRGGLCAAHAGGRVPNQDQRNRLQVLL